jgi:hypothetical protein
VSQQPRQGYAPDLPPGLPERHLQTPPEVPAATAHNGTHCARPVSTRFEPVSKLKDVTTPVPRVLLSVTLAGPAPSGSTGTSRLRQGCSRLPGTTRIRLPSAPPPCRDRTEAKVSHLHSNHSASRRKQAPLTGSGCREHSYGGFGGGHLHFHPHATPASNPRIKRQAHPCRESSKIVRPFGRAWVFAVAAVRRDPVPSDGVAARVAASVPVVASQVATNRQ